MRSRLDRRAARGIQRHVRLVHHLVVWTHDVRPKSRHTQLLGEFAFLSPKGIGLLLKVFSMCGEQLNSLVALVDSLPALPLQVGFDDGVDDLGWAFGFIACERD